jgi:type VI secretion system protein ImpA
MSVIDLDALLQPVSAEAPCGEDLEYSGLMDLERTAQGSAEQEIGRESGDGRAPHVLVAAREPNWQEVRGLALTLAGRTKDLRVLFHLTRALVRTDGFPGLQDGLALLRGTVAGYWECLYPAVDPDDQDPTLRVNTLASFDDYETLVRLVRDAPLVSVPGLGRFSLRDMAIARGELAAAEGTEAPSTATIEAAFGAADLGELQARASAVTSALDDLRAVDREVTDRLGAGNAPGLAQLPQVLREAQRVLREQLARRGVGSPEPAGETPVSAPATAGSAPAVAARVPGEVTSREDAVRVLDKVCEYYRRVEPSSPIPVLLERAKRLVGKDFMDIIKDVAPGGLAEVETLRGPQAD